MTRAFSLLELLLVTATLAVATLTITPVIRTDRSVLLERAVNVFCQVRLRNLGVATMLYAQDHSGSLPYTDAVNIAAGSIHTSWPVYRLHRDYLGGAPELTPAQWQYGRDPARNAYLHDPRRPAPFVCPVSIVQFTNATPAAPGPGLTQYTYTPGVNVANYWVGFNATPWLDITVEMAKRAEARYGGRWGLWYDRVQPNAIFTNWEITSAATHHRVPVAALARRGHNSATDTPAAGTAATTPAGGHAVWLDGSVSWRGYPGGWAHDYSGVWRPTDAIWLYANHPGHCEAQLHVPPPLGRASVPITGFCHPAEATRRTARQKLRALF